MPKLTIQKELTQADIDYISTALGYSETVTETNELPAMTMKEYSELESKDATYAVKLYTDESNVIVTETKQVPNTTTRTEYLANIMMSRINSEIENIMLSAEKQKLQQTVQEQEQKIVEGVKANVSKTPLVVEISEK